MAINNVKNAIMADLATLTTGNGYSTTIKTLYKVPKFPKDVDMTKCPAIACFLSDAPQDEFSENLKSFKLNYTLMVFTEAARDTDESGDAEIAIVKIYEDIVDLFNKPITNTFKLDEVRGVDVLGFFPLVQETKAHAYIPLQITYNK